MVSNDGWSLMKLVSGSLPPPDYQVEVFLWFRAIERLVLSDRLC